MQEREQGHLKLIAEMLGWFDVVALQELSNDLSGLRALQKELPKHYNVIFTDASGNRERICFLYNSKKVTTLEKVGEIAVPAEDLDSIKLEGVIGEFKGFSRSPFFGYISGQEF
jgi:hypothetical protein